MLGRFARQLIKGVSGSELYISGTERMSKIPNRHFGDPDFVSLYASSPELKVPDWVGEILSQSFESKNYPQGYRNRSKHGNIGLQDAAMQHFQGHGFDVSGCKNLFTQSIHEALYLVTDNLLDPKSDVILMTTPNFGLFFGAMNRRGFKIDLTPLDEGVDFKLTPGVLREMLIKNPNAGLFIFVNPDNPTGKSYSKKELKDLAEILVGHNDWRRARGMKELIIFSDEASNSVGPIDGIGLHHPSLGAFPGMSRFTLTMRSMSKTLAPSFGMSYGVGGKDLIERILDSRINLLAADFGPNQMAQFATEKLLTTHKEQFAEHVAKANRLYRDNMFRVTEFIDGANADLSQKYGINGGKFLRLLTKPEGGLQCLIAAPGFVGSKTTEGKIIAYDIDFSEDLATRKKVGILPGQACGFRGEDNIHRITISKDPKRLGMGLSRMRERFLKLELTPAAISQSRDDTSLRLESGRKGAVSNLSGKPMTRDDINLC